MKKRLISMALAVSMAVSIMPAPALATVGGGGQPPGMMFEMCRTQRAALRAVQLHRFQI